MRIFWNDSELMLPASSNSPSDQLRVGNAPAPLTRSTRIGRALFVDPVVVVGEDVLVVDAPEVGEERLGVADRHRAGAADGDGLEVLVAQEGAVTATSGLVVLVGGDAGPRELLLAGRPDGEDLGVLVEVVAQRLLDLRRLHAPVLGLRRPELDHVVLDRDDGRLGSAALDDDHVVAGELHLGRERAAHVAVVEDAGHRALAAHDEARRRADVGAGERPRDEEDGVVLRPGVETLRDLLPHVAQEQALAADVLLGPLHVERLDGGGARAQVDPEHFALVEVQCVLLKTYGGITTVPPGGPHAAPAIGSRERGSTGLCHSSRPGTRRGNAGKRPRCRAKRSRKAERAWPFWLAAGGARRTPVRAPAAKDVLRGGRPGGCSRLPAARPGRSLCAAASRGAPGQSGCAGSCPGASGRFLMFSAWSHLL